MDKFRSYRDTELFPVVRHEHHPVLRAMLNSAFQVAWKRNAMGVYFVAITTRGTMQDVVFQKMEFPDTPSCRNLRRLLDSFDPFPGEYLLEADENAIVTNSYEMWTHPSNGYCFDAFPKSPLLRLYAIEAIDDVKAEVLGEAILYETYAFDQELRYADGLIHAPVCMPFSQFELLYPGAIGVVRQALNLGYSGNDVIAVLVKAMAQDTPGNAQVCMNDIVPLT